jgi:hypothetical protein
MKIAREDQTRWRIPEMMVGSKLSRPDHHFGFFQTASVVYLEISSHSDKAAVAFNAGKRREDDCEECLTSTYDFLESKRATTLRCRCRVDSDSY